MGEFFFGEGDLQDYFVNNHFSHPQDYYGRKGIEQAADGVYKKQFWTTAVYFPKKAGDGFQCLKGILDAGFLFFFGN